MDHDDYILKTTHIISDIAKQIFEEYSDKLIPKIFFMILQNNIKQNPCIDIVPEVNHIDTTDLEKIKNSFIKTIQNIVNSDNVNHSKFCSYLFDSIINNKINKEFEPILNSICSAEISFVSQPVHIKNYIVLPVLQLNKTIAESIFIPIKIIKTEVNFLDYLINSFFDIVQNIILKQNQSEKYQVHRHELYDDTIKKKSANDFITKIINISIANINNSHIIKIICDRLSTITYESKPNNGQMIICTQMHDSVETILEFTDEINFVSKLDKKIRKLLEMTFDNLFLEFNGEHITKLVKINDIKKLHTNVIIIKFRGINEWELSNNDQILCTIKNDKIKYLTSQIIKTEFTDTISKKFKNTSNQNIKKLSEIIEKYTRKKGGALIIIAENAMRESKRLQKNAINIFTKHIDDETFQHLRLIDGAILLDLCGNIHSIGMILDGIDKNKGDISRGSRYNSAIRYVDKSKKSIAIIISEDGMIDIYPKLPNPISKYAFDHNYDNLLKGLDLPNPDHVKIAKSFEYINRNHFHLSAKQCKNINARFKKYCANSPESLFISEHKDIVFKYNVHMNSTFFYE